VYEDDTFEGEYGMETKMRHVPALKNRGDVVGFYAYFKTDNGGFGFSIMSVDDVRKHRDRHSEAARRGNGSPWETDFEAMAEKTVLKRALKHAPLSVELQNALASDGTVKTTISEDMFSEPVVFVETEAEDTIAAEEAVEVMSNNAE
jgi:recombination protein RecT